MVTDCGVRHDCEEDGQVGVVRALTEQENIHDKVRAIVAEPNRRPPLWIRHGSFFA